MVILIVVVSIWINNGQAKSLEVAKSVQGELTHYKEIQILNAQLIAAKIDTLGELVKASGTDRWTGHDHKVFSDRLQELNPSLHVPKLNER